MMRPLVRPLRRKGVDAANTAARMSLCASTTQGTRERFATEMAMHETVQAAAAMAALQATLREHRKCVEFDSQETLGRACDLLSTILTANSTRVEIWPLLRCRVWYL
jgi:inosine-uridine nucleoside N-ribohydrolase